MVKFNQTAREFFVKYYNKKKFSFTKEMAAGGIALVVNLSFWDYKLPFNSWNMRRQQMT
ncbi:hypothetical protein C7820_4208 [Paenibacillus sp. VMFN-D1]|nr:hypothetical protein C7820_4208 [Paenibacillus sp. VMFN-D1]